MQNENNKQDEKHNVLKPSPWVGEGGGGGGGRGEWLQSGVACSYIIYNSIINIIIINIYIVVSPFIGGGGEGGSRSLCVMG